MQVSTSSPPYGSAQDSIFSSRDFVSSGSQFLLDLEAATSEEKKAAVLKNYHDWEWTFPKELTKKTKKNLDKARLQKHIAELQEQLDKLDEKSNSYQSTYAKLVDEMLTKKNESPYLRGFQGFIYYSSSLS